MQIPTDAFLSLIHRETAAAERTELARLGFTDAQIGRLIDLRAVYPLVEFVDSREVLARLTFLKWLYGKRSRASAEKQTDV